MGDFTLLLSMVTYSFSSFIRPISTSNYWLRLKWSKYYLLFLYDGTHLYKFVIDTFMLDDSFLEPICLSIFVELCIF